MDELYVYFDAPETDLVEYQQRLMTIQQPAPTSRRYRRGGAGHEVRRAIPIGVRSTSARTASIPRPARCASAAAFRTRRAPTGARPLYPGLYAHVRVPSRRAASRNSTIPEDCIMTGQEGRFVYVVKPDNTVETAARHSRARLSGKPRRLIRAWRYRAGRWSIPNPAPARGRSAARAGAATGQVDGRHHGRACRQDRVIVEGIQKARPTLPVTPRRVERCTHRQAGRLAFALA